MNNNAFIQFFNRRIVLNTLYHVTRFLREAKEDRVILGYHSIAREGNKYSVSPELFAKHMKKLSENVRFVSLDEILRFAKKPSRNNRPMVAITFDDGYEDILPILPVLKRYKIPATVFALSDPEHANRSELDHTGKLLSYTQLKKLHAMGITIGCHSGTHADFDALPSNKRQSEVVLAKRTMERKLGFRIKYFAYPKGRYNQHVIAAVSKAGFVAALTTNHEVVTKDDNQYILPRVVIDGSYKATDFPAVIAASTFFMQRLHRLVVHNRIISAIKDLLRTSSSVSYSKRPILRPGKKITVSIGTSAYNEGKDIRHFLQNAIAQTGENIVVKEILIMADGCTDDTVNVVKEFSDKRIRLITHNTRLGKPTRLNELFQLFSSDILVIMDADGYLASKNSVARLVRPFLTDENVGLTAGRMDPVTPKTFIEKAAGSFFQAHYKAVRLFDYNKSAYGCHGLLAYKRSFAKSLSMPPECLGDDAFSYFSCISEGFSYEFLQEAVVRYRCPQTVRDYIKQSLRYYAAGEQLLTYFAKKDILDGYSLPRNVLLRTLFLQLKTSVFGYIALKCMQTYILYKTRVRNLELDVNWSMIQSSKML